MTSYSMLVRHTGNQGLFLAVEMSLLAAAAGRPVHLHAEGLRGTGKTTILRAARQILPRIERIQGCLYNCHPDRPHCPQHGHLDRQAVASLGTEWVPMPFLEISHSAKVGTVVGSIDLARLTDPIRPQAALLPGTLPQAHRGIVFIDEVNRLAETAPELADVLLDVMGTKPGRVQIEETGVPAVVMPVQVTIWAASNPDEEPGPLEEIRRQLADRFDFAISMARPAVPEVVEDILSLAESWDPAGVEREEPFDTTTDWPGRSRQLPLVQASPGLKRTLATLYTQFSLESLRAVEALYLGSRLHALLHGYREATVTDLLAVAGMALRHRVDGETLARILRFLQDLDGDSRVAGGGKGGSGRALLKSDAWTGTEGPEGRQGPQEGRSDLFSGLTSRLRQALGGRPRAGGPGQTAGRSGSSAQPATIPCVSPPHTARPLASLHPALWVATENELRLL
ncbi:MAG: magnesium chelatase [Symbiobacteriia bacterium]